MKRASTQQQLTNEVMSPACRRVDWETVGEAALDLSLHGKAFELCHEAAMIESAPDHRMKHLARLMTLAAASHAAALDVIGRLSGIEEVLSASDVEEVVAMRDQWGDPLTDYEIERLEAVRDAALMSELVIQRLKDVHRG